MWFCVFWILIELNFILNEMGKKNESFNDSIFFSSVLFQNYDVIDVRNLF